MPTDLNNRLVIGIAASALFDMREADAVFRSSTSNLAGYRKYMLERENSRLDAGTGFPLVKGLLALNKGDSEPLVDVVLMSRNDADSGRRILNSIDQWQLGIERAAFTDGRRPFEYLEAFSCNLYLSTVREDVISVIKTGFPAALVYKPPKEMELTGNEVRIAFDGDAVIFSDESDKVFREGGIPAFQAHEAKHADIPMKPGPLKGFLEALSKIQNRFPEENPQVKCPIRVSLVTARALTEHRRPLDTLRKWNIRLDESFFMGGVPKAGILRALKPHIFFDDSRLNLEPSCDELPVAEVPGDLTEGGIQYDKNPRKNSPPKA